jgi:chemotaxis protein MotB
MTSSRRRQRHEEPEEHVNHERWLVTYADMLTLLMVLFIIMFAMSQVDEVKYNALAASLAEGFGSDSVSPGTNSVFENQAVGPELVANPAYESLPAEQQRLVADAVDAEQQRRQQQRFAEAQAEAERLERVQARLREALERAGLADDVQTVIDERGLVVSLVSRHVVFRPDVAELSARGRTVVDTLAPVLRKVPNTLRIDGHTNQEPVKPRYYDTDWDLSAARAVTVLRRLHSVGKVPQERLSLSAFGHERPLVDPDRPGSQQVNKRVDIVVLPRTDEESSRLIDDVMDARPGQQGARG